MGFSIRLAPGVRVRASSRGLRASLGPRIARVHVGGGRTGVSTGAGPVSYYTPLGGRRSAGRSGGGPSPAAYRQELAAYRHTPRQAQRLQEAERLAEAFTHLLNLHRVEFPPVTPPAAPEPRPPDRAAVWRHYEQHALRGIGPLRFRARAAARRRAAEWTEAEVRRQWAEACDRQRWQQRELDEWWRRLSANEPDPVLTALAEAFEDNEAPAAPVDVDGHGVSLAVLVPPMAGTVPERMPTTTDAGNLSLRKLPQRDRADYYKQFVAGQALVTVREAFAVAPGAMVARVVVLRDDGPDAYGRPGVSCLLAVRIERAALAGVRWHEADATRIVRDVATERLCRETGRTRELAPLDLSDEPELARLVEAVDASELVGDGAPGR